ncbi:MAG: GAF domain-containing protein [Chloroflexota bacterium]|nr:GAF domain-containing protein [Chloroflexota bacterium]
MSRTPSKPNPDLTPTGQIKLSKQLAGSPDLKSRVQYLLAYLRANFECDAALRLNNPPKHLERFIPDQDLPTDVLNGKAVCAYQENETSFWLVRPLSEVEQGVGRVILHRDRAFTAMEKRKFSEVCRLAGMAIIASLQAAMQSWRQKQLALVQSVSARIARFTDLDSLTEAVTKLVQETFNYYYVAVFLIDENTERLTFKASAGADESDRPDFENLGHPGFALGEHMIGYVAQSGQELVANDVTLEPRYKEVDSLDDTQSEVVLPLSVTDSIFGVFDVQADQINAFNPDDLLVLRALADNIAIAVESTRLLQDVQRRADQLAAVAEASRTLTLILEKDELLNRIVNLIHTRFGFPFVHLYLVDPVQKQVSFTTGSGQRTARFAEAGISYDLDAQQGLIPWVVQNGQTKRINDVETEPLYLDTPFAEDQTGSELAVPLFFGGNVLGVLDIQSEQKNAFSKDDQQLIETLADNVAIAIRNARLYRSEQWRRQVAESLRDVAGLLSDNTALEDLLDAILTQLGTNLPCDVAGIWLFDPDSPEELPAEGRTLYLAAHQTNEAYETIDLGKIRFTPDAWVKDALTRKQPTIRQSDETIGPIARQCNMPQDYSSIAAPLHTGDEILGMLTLIHHSPGRYGLESQKITSAFASYVAIAIENTRLYETSQEQAWVSTILLQVAQAIQTQTNLDELAQTIVRLTPMVVGIKGCALFLRNPDLERYSLHAMYGIGKNHEEIDLQQPLPLPNAPRLAELTLTQEPMLVLAPEEDLHLPKDLAREIEGDTLILFPLIARQEVLGAFMLANDPDAPIMDDRNELIGEERLSIIRGIIQQTATAIENIRLLEARQEEAYISTALLQAAQAVVTSADLLDTLDSIVHLMPILVGIDSSAIYLWDKETQTFTLTEATIKDSMDEELLIGTTYEPGDFPLLDTVSKNNRPIVFPFVETLLTLEDWDLALPDEGQVDPTPVLQTRYPLLLGFPLAVKDEVYGVLLAQDNNVAANRERRFELLWGIAQQVSLAIQNDLLNKEMLDRQRLEREFQLAREIQQTFLPSQTPPMPGWEMDVRWDTARQVGGDFYDYFLLPDGRLAFVIADVSNKGLAASLYMTVTRTLIRAAALENTSPARTLERVNELLLMDSQNGLFVTTFYGILSLKEGLLSYCIAGHNPPLILRSESGEVRELGRGGIALGAMPDITLEERHLEILPGDCLVLYTDGVTEAFNTEDDMYGDDRLITLLKSAVGKTAHQVLEIIENDLNDFRQEASLSDDTTLLAICREALLTDQDGDGHLS